MISFASYEVFENPHPEKEKKILRQVFPGGHKPYFSYNVVVFIIFCKTGKVTGLLKSLHVALLLLVVILFFPELESSLCRLQYG